jgi:hypothetical protein
MQAIVIDDSSTFIDHYEYVVSIELCALRSVVRKSICTFSAECEGVRWPSKPLFFVQSPSSRSIFSSFLLEEEIYVIKQNPCLHT